MVQDKGSQRFRSEWELQLGILVFICYNLAKQSKLYRVLWELYQ